MTAAKHKLLIEQGATFNDAFQWLESAPDPVNAPDTPGDPIDITGFEIRAKFRTGSRTGTVFLDTSTVIGNIVITSGTDGKFEFAVSDAVTGALTIADFLNGAFWDLEIEDLLGVVERVLEGSVKFSENVTR